MGSSFVISFSDSFQCKSNVDLLLVVFFVGFKVSVFFSMTHKTPRGISKRNTETVTD